MEGRGYRDNKPQYQHLGSGVNLLPNDYITPAIESAYKNQQGILADQLAEQEKKRAAFNQLLEVSLKDIKGRFRDEAIQTKQDAISDIASQFAKSDTITPQLMIKLQDKKDELEGLMGMYSGIESWYKTAADKAATLDDPRDRDATIQNIADIMEKSGSIKDTYQAIIGAKWLVTPPPDVDPAALRKSLLDATDNIVPVETQKSGPYYGNVMFRDIWEKDQAQLARNNATYWEANKRSLQRKGFNTQADWDKFVGTGIMPGEAEIRGVNYAPDYGGSGSKNKKEPINIIYNEAVGGWSHPDQPITVGGFDMVGADGKTARQNMSITQVVRDPASGKYYATITTPGISKLNVEELKAAFTNPEIFDYALTGNMEKLITKDSKSQVNSDIIKVPIEYMEDIYTRADIKLEDFVFDPKNIGIIERHVPGYSSGKTQAVNPADPLGITGAPAPAATGAPAPAATGAPAPAATGTPAPAATGTPAPAPAGTGQGTASTSTTTQSQGPAQTPRQGTVYADRIAKLPKGKGISGYAGQGYSQDEIKTKYDDFSSTFNDPMNKNNWDKILRGLDLAQNISSIDKDGFDWFPKDLYTQIGWIKNGKVTPGDEKYTTILSNLTDMKSYLDKKLQ